MSGDKVLYECYATISSINDEVFSAKKQGVGRAVAGGIMFGGAGAIVGAVTAKSKAESRKVASRDGYGKIKLLTDKFVFSVDDSEIIVPINCIRGINTSFYTPDHKTALRLIIIRKNIANISDEEIHNTLLRFVDNDCYFEIEKSNRKEIKKLANDIVKKSKSVLKNKNEDLKQQKIKRKDRKLDISKNTVLLSWSNMIII